MKRRLLTGILLVSCLALASAQGTFQPRMEADQELKGIVYNKELTFDVFKMHTNGFAVGVNFGTIRTYYLTRFFHLGLGELKHPKQVRTSLDRPTAGGRVSRSFVYGKQNNLYVLRGGYGEKRYFSEKATKRGVAVGISYMAGPSLGLLKPYYLEVLSSEFGSGPFAQTASIRYNEENAQAFLNPWNIFGATGWSKGLGEISLIPGIQTQFALHLDWGAFDEFVKAMDVGVMADLYFRRVPIMVELPGVENSPFFLNLFVNLQLGKRN